MTRTKFRSGEVFKSMKTPFKSISKTFAMLKQSDLFEVIAIGTALALTAGAAGGALGLVITADHL